MREGDVLTIYCIEEFVYDIINKPEVLTAIADVASAQAGTAVEVKLHKGAPLGIDRGRRRGRSPGGQAKAGGLHGRFETIYAAASIITKESFHYGKGF